MISVNGVAIDEARLQAELPRHQHEPDPAQSASRELVLRELLLQRARELGLAQGDNDADVRAVLAAEVRTPQADEAACRRYYEQHPGQFLSGALVEVWHILFQLTPRVDPRRLRARAGEVLQEVHRAAPDAFADYARQYSNCMSAQEGGRLGDIGRGDTLPEFEQAVFAMPAHTLLDRLVQTRHGFHIVRTGRKVEGTPMAFDAVHARIAAWLAQASERRATHQYLQWLVGQARIEGLDMPGADSPLLQ
ncbi:peptidylprolyl isomerase [Bordetella petrii]|uniref:peptidylprolyl isomerase n=1 Tax=Bordetella petrii (strain ATCC BAA-461 / DSM 12804 / CCUG 43448 / CIP 107267 / Se-1111R) TaxID=340100 RepID=A9I3F7_BORPD|nr:peptidylprolyl isomerase [Bordetella petrii]CAP44168.1 PPIC-type PPIASE domain protein [Bordetella petrii]